MSSRVVLGVTLAALVSACSLDESGLLVVIPTGDASPDSSDGDALHEAAGDDACSMCDGHCQDLRADTQNCGACGNVCGATKPPLTGGGVWACSEGQCVVTCTGPLSACGGGCFDLTSDHDHCGQCTNACASDRTCCNNACANIQEDNANCGQCGATCGGTCSGGACCVTASKGSCGHELCSPGSALSSSCDGTQGCVAKVCGADPYCCSLTWDSTCASEVMTYCAPLRCSC
jgi:hypothetical protein